ncbi:cytochrome P450 [Streptomyces sp. 891-h]|uniref:cytochrome P450 n=1 Tax=Streptomyces sp. 891-h TaxID=2720714 RepID=UPI001FA97AB6|nr:cytochrome P450 [Streptomyces sp. 891-h]UNZ20473.1 cytochrome P450 [Streptomyces sp. 891-h]
MPATTIPSTDIDPYTDDSILSPYEDYRRLRDLGPVVWLEAHQVFAVARYREVYDALHDHTTFSSASGVGLTETLNKAQKGSSFTSDPPYHGYVRGLVARHLKPKALEQFHDYIEGWATRLVDELIEKGEFDAVTDFAQAFPLAVVPDLLGWPIEEGKERLLEWATAGFNAFGPLNERTQRGFPLLKEMSEFLERMSVPGNLRPGSWGAQLVSDAKEGKIEEYLLPGLLGDFLAPSMDTSVSALSSMLWLLGTHQDQWEQLRAEPARIPQAFNEILRIESPLRGFTRLVTRERELGGVRLDPESRVLLLYGSANRDERQWKDPETFDIDRPGVTQHIGFGHGIHGCVGQALSRLEGHSLLKALAGRVTSIEVGEPTWRLHNTIRGIASLPVTLRT